MLQLVLNGNTDKIGESHMVCMVDTCIPKQVLQCRPEYTVETVVRDIVK